MNETARKAVRGDHKEREPAQKVAKSDHKEWYPAQKGLQGDHRMRGYMLIRDNYLASHCEIKLLWKTLLHVAGKSFT